MLGGAGPRRRSRDECYPPRRARGAPRPPLRPAQRTWLHRQPEIRDGSLPQYSFGRAAGGGGGRVAVQPSRPGRAVHPRRTDPDGGQLERRMAGPGRDAQSERVPDQGRREVRLAVERRFHRRVFHHRAAALAGRRTGPARYSATCIRWRSSGSRSGPGRSAQAWPPACGATRPSWASSTRAAWACTTPSSPTSCCIPRAFSRSG